MKIKSFPAQFKALAGDDEAAGQFEAIVAVFNNVDHYGERILPGAFSKSLARWKESGYPIPILFAHQWDNLDAHIGYDLGQAKETDKGLYVKGQLDMEEPFAARVFKRMQQGRLKEFSFAYDVVEAKEAEDAYDLIELDLYEYGPCLVGVNPETELIAAKALALDLVLGTDLNGSMLEQATEIAGRVSALFMALGPQKLHEIAVTLGATCAQNHTGHGEDEGSGDDEATDGKSRRHESSVIAVRIAAELIENGISTE